MGYRLDGLGSIPGRGKIFLFSIECRPGVGLNQHSVQWVLGAVSMRVKQQGREAYTHFHLVPRLRMVELYINSPIHFHDVVCN
jgi:hypothetical protein